MQIETQAMDMLGAATKISGFRTNSNGQVGITIAMVLVPAMLFVGAAIDFADAYRAQTQLQTAVEAAVEAAAAMPGGTRSADRQAKAQQVFSAGVAGIDVAHPTPVVIGRSISLSVSGSVRTSFLGLANVSQLIVRAGATGTFEDEGTYSRIPSAQRGGAADCASFRQPAAATDTDIAVAPSGAAGPECWASASVRSDVRRLQSLER